MSRRQDVVAGPGGRSQAGGSVYVVSGGVKYVVFDARKNDGLLNPETWAYLWGKRGMVEKELRLWEEKAGNATEDGEREEARQMAEFLRRLVEATEAASLCKSPEEARRAAEICIGELIFNRNILRILDFDDPRETQSARFWWLVECVRDGCGEVERGSASAGLW